MANKRKQQIHNLGLYELRRLLGWNQSDIAEVLGISRSEYSMLELRNRCVRPGMKEKMEYLEKLALTMESAGIPKQPSPQTMRNWMARELLQARVRILEIEIEAKEEKVENFKLSIEGIIQRYHLYNDQLTLLKEMGAPEFISRCVKMRVNDYDNKAKKKKIEEVIRQEARITGMKAEMQHIQEYLKNMP